MTADTPTPVVPNLRFPEFRSAGDWHFQPLSDIAKPISERVGTSKCVPMSVTTGVGLLSQEEKFGRTIAGNSYKNYIRLQTNDFAYNKSATKEFPQGYIARYSGTRDAAVPNSIFACFRPDIAAVIPEYLDHLFHRNHHGRWLRKYITVGARAHGALSVSDDDLMSMPVPLPPDAVSCPEQQKIADCLGSLDDLIAAEGRKLDALRQHKQGLMQQLFPQPGETVPRLRFPEFEDAGPWEQLTIDEAADLKNGYAFKSDTYIESGDFQIVTIGNVQEGRLDLESTKSIATLPRDIQNHQILKPADILVSMTGNVGRVCLVPVDGLLLNQRVGKLIPCRIDHDFFFQMLNRDKFRSAMQLAAAGGAQGNVSAGEIKSFVFARPVDPREQRGIADCLSTLDTQIAAQVRKLDALRQHKQGLTQQLFPSLEAESR